MEKTNYHGTSVIAGWPEKIEDAQRASIYMIDGVAYGRIRYGEDGYESAKERACRDCAVIEGLLHVPGCDMERCPVCSDQAFCCACNYDDVVDGQRVARGMTEH